MHGLQITISKSFLSTPVNPDCREQIINPPQTRNFQRARKYNLVAVAGAIHVHRVHRDLSHAHTSAMGLRLGKSGSRCIVGESDHGCSGRVDVNTRLDLAPREPLKNAHDQSARSSRERTPRRIEVSSAATSTS